MKKTIISLALFCLASCFLYACGKENPLLTIEDYKLDTENGSTSRGVKIGDNAQAFQAAYQDYMMFSAISGDASQADDAPNASAEDTSDNVLNTSSEAAYQFLPADEIPFDAVETIILPTFFIDGLPVDMNQFCEDNELEKANILSYLTDASYLADHRVIYRYLIFTWEDGAITDIRSESMDYNQDASYYEAN